MIGINPAAPPSFPDLLAVQRRTCASQNALPAVFKFKEGGMEGGTMMTLPAHLFWAAVVAKGGYHLVSGVPSIPPAPCLTPAHSFLLPTVAPACPTPPLPSL